jgi:ribosome-binding protein aMBF1 (putative translation factor)
MQASTMIGTVATESTFTEQLRRAIDESGMSRREVCARIGLDESVMSRFMAGRSGLALSNVDRLCALLGLKLVKARRTRRSKR